MAFRQIVNTVTGIHEFALKLKVFAFHEQVSFSAIIPCFWKLVFKVTIRCSLQTLAFITDFPGSFSHYLWDRRPLLCCSKKGVCLFVTAVFVPNMRGCTS